ncbi:MAG: tRNA threonylcarbamoyladenosine biosynthesis protein TsaE [bacterium ADurb.Bin400]|nr:MAG: tRNA threonylcarbamoyladenosine biosynthesis protein TsaE [bacterium ADurb.Bin400]
MEYIATSEEATYKIAEEVLKGATGGDIFALQGDLGAGKTTFVKGIARALGIAATITSPTFVLFKEYSIPENQSAVPSPIQKIVHVDAYRMHSIADAEAIGLPEYFERDDVMMFIEWPERIEQILPPRTKYLVFEYIDEKTRKVVSH